MGRNTLYRRRRPPGRWSSTALQSDLRSNNYNYNSPRHLSLPDLAVLWRDSSVVSN